MFCFALCFPEALHESGKVSWRPFKFSRRRKAKKIGSCKIRAPHAIPYSDTSYQVQGSGTSAERLTDSISVLAILGCLLVFQCSETRSRSVVACCNKSMHQQSQGQKVALLLLSFLMECGRNAPSVLCAVTNTEHRPQGKPASAHPLHHRADGSQDCSQFSAHWAPEFMA